MDDEYLIKAALALDPNLPIPEAKRPVDPPEPPEPPMPGVQVHRILAGYDRDGDPVYVEHAFIGGK